MNANLRAIALGLQTGVPIHSEGLPGDGKTSWAKGLGVALGRPVVILTPSLYEPTDLAGYPAVSYGLRTTAHGHWEAIPQGVTLTSQWWATQLAATPGVLVVDEIRTLSRSMQAVALRIIFELMAGDTPLHPDTLILALSNPVALSPDGRDLAAPLANRFCHIPWKMTQQEWFHAGQGANWTTSRPTFPGSAFPLARPGWKAQIPFHFAQISAFGQARQDLMREVPNTLTAQGQAWPSRRTWTFAAQMLAVAHDDHEVRDLLLAGCVGPGPAAEYLGWLQARDLPDFEALLETPETLSLPRQAEGDRQLAILLGLVACVAQHLTPNRWSAGWRVLSLATTQVPLDVVAVAARYLAGLRTTQTHLPFPDESVMEPFFRILRDIGIPIA